MMASYSRSDWMTYISISFEGCWAVPEIPMKESQDAVCFLCDGVM